MELIFRNSQKREAVYGVIAVTTVLSVKYLKSSFWNKNWKEWLKIQIYMVCMDRKFTSDYYWSLKYR